MLASLASWALRDVVQGAKEGADTAVKEKQQALFLDLLKQCPPILVTLHQAIEKVSEGKESETAKSVEKVFSDYLKPSTPSSSLSTEEFEEDKEENSTDEKSTQFAGLLQDASKLTKQEQEHIQKLIDALKTASSPKTEESPNQAGTEQTTTTFQEAKEALDKYLVQLIAEKSGMLQHAMTRLTEGLTAPGGTFESFATSIRTSMAAALADPAPREVIEAESTMSALLVAMKGTSEPNKESAKTAFNNLLNFSGYAKLTLAKEARTFFKEVNQAFQDKKISPVQIEKAHEYLFALRCETSGLVQRVMLRTLDTAIKQLGGLFGLNVAALAEESGPKKESELDKALGSSAIGHPAVRRTETSMKPEPVDNRPVQERIIEQRALFVQNALRTALVFRAISWSPEAESTAFATKAMSIVKSSQKEANDVFINNLRQAINESGWSFYKRWGARFEILTTQSMLEYFLTRITDKAFEEIERNVPADKEARERLLDRGISSLIDDLATINEIYEVINKEEGHTAGIETVVDAKLKDPRLYGKLQPSEVENKFFRKILLEYVPDVSLRSFITRKLENFRLSKSYLIFKLFNLVLALITNIIWAFLTPIFYVIDQISTFLLRALVKFTPFPTFIRKKIITGDQKSKFGKAYSHAINSVLLTKLKEIEASFKTPSSAADSKTTDSRFVGEILSENAKGNVQKLVANISLLLENQRYRTHTQLRTDKASQPFQSVNTISRLSLTIFGIDLNIKSAASEEAANQLASALSSILRKEQVDELLCSTLKSINESLLSTETVSDGDRVNTESAMVGKLHEIVNFIIRQAIEGQLQPEVRYQAYVDRFMGNVKMACAHLTGIVDFSKETSQSLTEKKNAVLNEFSGLRTSLVTEIGNTKNHPLDGLLNASIEPLCAFFNRNIQLLITRLGAMETTITKLQEKQAKVEALHKLAEQIPSFEALLKTNLEEMQKLADGLATETDLKDFLSSIPGIRKGLLEQYEKKRSLQDLASAYFVKEATIEALPIDEVDKEALKNKLSGKTYSDYAKALANDKYRVNFDPFTQFTTSLSEKKTQVTQQIEAAEKDKSEHLKTVQKQVQDFKVQAEKPTAFKCQPVHFLKYVSNEQVRFTILQIITNLVSAEILPDVKQAPASASKGYLNAFFVSRMLSRFVGNALPITVLAPYNGTKAK